MAQLQTENPSQDQTEDARRARKTIPYIPGDGVGPEIWAAAVEVFDAAVSAAYSGRRRVDWMEVQAGEKAYRECGQYLPPETMQAFMDHQVGIKGPLATPVGGGIRSVNVALRVGLDLYACIRPIRYLPGVASPVKEPEKVNIVVFRENTEDVYAGLEWASGSPEARQIIDFLHDTFGTNLRQDAAVGIKPMSPFGSKRLVRKAIQWAIDQSRRSVTLVHKGNIMKFTEGGFRQWGYELAAEEFGRQTVPESALGPDGSSGQDQIVIKDRIADAMFQNVLLWPQDYDVLALPNLNGDYMSDALAAQVGGLGMAPGANIGDQAAVFEATHGTAPGLAGKDQVNPGSLILSGALMYDHLGWTEAAQAIRSSLEATIAAGTVTRDLAQDLPEATVLSCSEFGHAVASRIR
ncbi:NADP-dependent isocitrate dehydrogenase [Desulfovermiculus halophilus]|jgi:isocitrate dehydrogenase|uniref:NADP-dependent isocitrate dehydrogenase n=1 Tax=Desulfovermiculus halophilus TaxID=339722 RepID=UPI000A04060F|nr:NADP-dependent isocitrate dehydrogenase [Desulfovermiculus halophilus]